MACDPERLARPCTIISICGVGRHQIGDDKTCIGSVRAGLDAGDDALDAAPALRASKNSLKRRTLPFFAAAANIAVALASRGRICARSVKVGATPKMKSRPWARQKSIVSGVQ
jgi:hypothetical protein